MLTFFTEVCQTDTEFRCNNGICIDKNLRCNGVSDCSDFTDELDCQTDQKPKTNQNGCESEYEWMCMDGSECIDKRRLCDGYSNCGDNSDENAELCTKGNNSTKTANRYYLSIKSSFTSQWNAIYHGSLLVPIKNVVLTREDSVTE